MRDFRSDLAGRTDLHNAARAVARRHRPPPIQRTNWLDVASGVGAAAGVTWLWRDQGVAVQAASSGATVITGTRPEPRSKSADHCWHVCYQFCGLSAEITVDAENEAEARAKAVDQLRLRGLKVA